MKTKLYIVLFPIIFILLTYVPAQGHYSLIVQYASFFIEIEEPTWINATTPISLGYTYKDASISYTFLNSNALASYGDRISVSYTYKTDKISPYLLLTGETYRRSLQGGIGIAGGIEFAVNNYFDIRLGIIKSWLTGPISPQISIRAMIP